jgi:hypothetical protein
MGEDSDEEFGEVELNIDFTHTHKRLDSSIDNLSNSGFNCYSFLVQPPESISIDSILATSPLPLPTTAEMCSQLLAEEFWIPVLGRLVSPTHANKQEVCQCADVMKVMCTPFCASSVSDCDSFPS